MIKFNIENSPLNGINLIEASAGTGKTYTLSGLFVRFILEKNMAVDQILVVTFTKAATEELRERIRKRIYETRQLILENNLNAPELQHIQYGTISREDVADKLKKALEDFDRASILTIHSFCQKILFENAFEAGSLFDTELVNDQSALMRCVAEDFWRKYFYEESLEFLMFAAHCGIKGPEYFYKLYNKKKCPDIKIIPQPEKPEISSCLSDYKENLNFLRREWQASKETVSTILKTAPLNGRQYGTLKPDKNSPEFTGREIKLLRFFSGMDVFLSDRITPFPVFEDFKYFTASYINKNVNSNNTPPFHHFFETCDKFQYVENLLQEVMCKWLLFLKAEFFKYAASETAQRKKTNNIKFFDDLLIQVRNALSGEGGRTLASSIRKLYKAALVDEFQDTDFIQYEIFSRLFSSSDSPLFMIGDPKQAIYGFRGADVFSYIQASKNAENRYTLDQNWRSTPGMIDAVNTIFSGHHFPFVFPEIPFNKVSPGGQGVDKKDAFKTPLTVWFFGKENATPLSVTDATERITEAVADQILNLVSHKTETGDEHTIDPGEIAVLVRTNRQTGIIKQALSQKNIPAVLYCDEDVFHSREALEIERILSSIAEPSNERKFRAAIVSDLIGISGEELDESESLSSVIPALRSDFNNYHRLWIQNGFIRMFRRFMSQAAVRIRLLRFTDGERRLTNVLHIAELIHQCEFEKRLSIRGLLKWISDKRIAETAIEEHQLRLESDARSVKILTIHKSKGLEFPVVFCPFCWSDSAIKDDVICYHDEDNRGMIMDIGSDLKESAIVRARNELLAENMRLLYVALTRSRLKCYLAWGWINRMETSSLAYLLHYNAEHVDWNRDDIVSTLSLAVKNKDGKTLFNDIQKITGQSENIRLEPIENFVASRNQYQGQQKFRIEHCRTFNGRISSSFRIASYSSLSTGISSDHIALDYDRINRLPEKIFKSEIKTDFTSIFSFPKGARAGIFFHDIFEHLDFTVKDPSAIKLLIDEKLKAYGFDLQWGRVVFEMVHKLISTLLCKDDNCLTLSDITPGDRINEMEFYFPLKKITPSSLKDIFNTHEASLIPYEFPEQLGRLSFLPTEGFVKGFIDLVFRHNGKYYLLDWKSNFLGDSLKDYDQSSLKQVMLEDNYILQYYLYSLALHQFLKSRVSHYNYDTHFGGVYYLFIRGVGHGSETGNGIYFDLPDFKLITAMEKAMIRQS